MSWMRMPLFVWAIEIYSRAARARHPRDQRRHHDAAPRPAGSDALLLPDQGGNAVLYQHLFWFFGHPEVYIIILPAMGVISEVIPVFSRKPIFGYKAIAFSTVAIGFYSMLVWAHHMFSVGMPSFLNVFFMLSSMVIAVPTGVKIFNWIATTWRGNLIFDTAMLWALGFVGVFTVGGLSGIFLAAYPVDWQVTDTYFVVAHMHYVLFGGAVFGAFAGLFYWWPKIFGRMLDEGLGKAQFWLVFIGFNLTFFPQHMLGLMGMPRRIFTYDRGGLFEAYNLSLVNRLRRHGARPAHLRRQRRQDPAVGAARSERPMGRRHARVVHDVAAARAQLRPPAVHRERAPAARPQAAHDGGRRWLTRAPVPGCA